MTTDSNLHPSAQFVNKVLNAEVYPRIRQKQENGKSLLETANEILEKPGDQDDTETIEFRIAMRDEIEVANERIKTEAIDEDTKTKKLRTINNFGNQLASNVKHKKD
ncbi:hypothetical protein KJ632_03955 [Patescibacteria group bacterium]|nr:hypothetical protein [Patescibacteria group bacterium]